jgi:hypothetical protein
VTGVGPVEATHSFLAVRCIDAFGIAHTNPMSRTGV